jgi:thiamine pyrophosphokinase
VDHAVVVIGGASPDARALELLDRRAVVVAADSGLDHAIALGLDVDVVVGDLDSVSPESLAWAAAHGVPVERFPTDKDATDTELAIDVAVGHGARHVVILTGSGDTAGPGAGRPGEHRIDHLLSVLLLLGNARFAGVALEAWVGGAHLLRLTGPGRLVVPARAGETLSLLPIGGAATGITTAGLRFPLLDETLAAGTSRGVSNVADRPHPSVTVAQGTLLVIRPEALP